MRIRNKNHTLTWFIFMFMLYNSAVHVDASWNIFSWGCNQKPKNPIKYSRSLSTEANASEIVTTSTSDSFIKIEFSDKSDKTNDKNYLIDDINTDNIQEDSTNSEDMKLSDDSDDTIYYFDEYAQINDKNYPLDDINTDNIQKHSTNTEYLRLQDDSDETIYYTCDENDDSAESNIKEIDELQNRISDDLKDIKHQYKDHINELKQQEGINCDNDSTENFTIEDDEYQVSSLIQADDDSSENADLTSKFEKLLHNTLKEVQNFGLAQELQKVGKINNVLQAEYLKAFNRELEHDIDGTWLAYQFDATNNEYEPLYLMRYKYNDTEKSLEIDGPFGGSLLANEIHAQTQNYEFDFTDDDIHEMKIINDTEEPYWMVNVDNEKMHKTQKDIEYFKKNKKLYPISAHASMDEFIKYYFKKPPQDHSDKIYSTMAMGRLDGTWLAYDFNDRKNEYKPLYFISYNFFTFGREFSLFKSNRNFTQADYGEVKRNKIISKINEHKPGDASILTLTSKNDTSENVLEYELSNLANVDNLFRMQITNQDKKTNWLVKIYHKEISKEQAEILKRNIKTTSISLHSSLFDFTRKYFPDFNLQQEDQSNKRKE